MPRPSISTVFPSATPRSTMRATCWQESQHSATPLHPLPLEGQPAAGSRAKAPQTRKPRLFPLAQPDEYFLVVQKLFGNGVARPRGTVAFQVHLCLGEQILVSLQRPLRLQKSGAVWTRIDVNQRIALT